MSKETIGPKIKQFRKKRKLTQNELAESLGYSGKSVISHIEKGKGLVEKIKEGEKEDISKMSTYNPNEEW